MRVVLLCVGVSKWCQNEKVGPHRESNPGPLAPEARIIPLDQTPTSYSHHLIILFIFNIHTVQTKKTKYFNFYNKKTNTLIFTMNSNKNIYISFNYKLLIN